MLALNIDTKQEYNILINFILLIISQKNMARLGTLLKNTSTIGNPTIKSILLLAVAERSRSGNS